MSEEYKDYSSAIEESDVSQDDKIYDIHFDAYAPSEMAKRVEKIGVTKAKLSFWHTLALSILAGFFIGLGAEFYTYIIHDSVLSLGLTGLIGGIGFTLGLILVVIAGAELFTGNNLIVMAFVQDKISSRDLLRNWGIVFLGNFIGCIIVVLLVLVSQQWAMNDGLVGARAILIANTKVSYPYEVALTRGILCNALVTLAVWLSIGGRHVIDKIVAILFPITAFVASGFEHSIANMYFVPMGIILSRNSELVKLAENIGGNAINPSMINWYSFLINNLIPVTLGNIIGGSVFVGLAYWYIYLKPNTIVANE